MPPIPEPRPLLQQLLIGLGRLYRAGARQSHQCASTASRRSPRGQRQAAARTRGGIGQQQQPWANGAGPRLRPQRGSLGTALVQALMAGLIAIIAAFLLASRLLASRFNSFSRSDTLAAREAAEYGLNELQAQLNSDLYGYLWVTKRNNWSSVSRAALTACQVSSLDTSGNEVSILPALPDGISSPKTIKTGTDATITYQLTSFAPPSLPDSDAATQNQADFCGSSNSASAANFGNLNGGSALITVTGTVTRGSNQTQFRLSRRPHVVSPARQLAFSFIILGDAYNDTVNKETFGAANDIAKLNYFDGNICYGKITDTTCFTNPALPKTVIGCYDLGSCLVNNIDVVDAKLRSKYCADVKAKKKKKKGFTCNDFQQITTLPPTPTPRTTGFLNDSGTPYTDSDWNAKAVDLECKLKDDKCKSNLNGDFNETFPYKRNTAPTSLTGLRNSDLVDGCFFNNVNSQLNTTIGANTNAVNCFFKKVKIKDPDAQSPNLLVYTTSSTQANATTLLPVNIFLYGTDPVTLDNGGIDNSDRSDLGWNRLRILGKEVPPAAGSSVSCAQSAGIVSKKGNDLNNLFLWLPNASLNYDRKGSKDNSYMVVWVCEFLGPKKDGSTKYSIITPIPEKLVRAGLYNALGSSFTKAGGGTYRGFGSEDSSTP